MYLKSMAALRTMTKFTKGNTAASKPLDQHQTARVVLAVTPAEKVALVQAAYPRKLSDYLRGLIYAPVQSKAFKDIY